MRTPEVDPDNEHRSTDIGLINQFEAEVGHTFPLGYKELLREYDAVWLEDRDFEFIYNGEVDGADVVFYGYGSHLAEHYKIRNIQPDEYSHGDVVVFGTSGGGEHICFDYRQNPTTNNPPVVIMLHDELDETGKMLVCPVADDFERFIESLCDLDDEEDSTVEDRESESE